MPICNKCDKEHNRYFKNRKAKKSCGLCNKSYKKLYETIQKSLEEYCIDHIEYNTYYKLLPNERLHELNTGDLCSHTTTE